MAGDLLAWAEIVMGYKGRASVGRCFPSKYSAKSASSLAIPNKAIKSKHLYQYARTFLS